MTTTTMFKAMIAPGTIGFGMKRTIWPRTTYSAASTAT